MMHEALALHQLRVVMKGSDEHDLNCSDEDKSVPWQEHAIWYLPLPPFEPSLSFIFTPPPNDVVTLLEQCRDITKSGIY